MATSVGSATNIGDALRSGVVLTASEAVAIAFVVCRQADEKRLKVMARRADEISITANGDVSARPEGDAESPGASVAALLESLLPPDASTSIPPALRSLPARLRAATSSTDSGLRDLQSILRWHLRDDAQQILLGLGKRLSSPAATPASRSNLALVKQAPPKATPVAEPAKDTELQITPSLSDAPLDLPLQPTEPPAPVDSKSLRRFGTRRTGIAGAAILMALAGYAGYRITANLPPQLAAAGISSVPPPTVKVPPPVSAAREHPNLPNPQPLSLKVNDGAFSPAFTPDGSALFFHSGREAGRLLEISLAPQRERAIRSVLADPARNSHPRPSPDNRWVAFDSDRGGTRAVYVMGVNGDGLQNVSGPGFAAVPNWSPDMQWLAFVRGEAWRPSVWNVWLRHLQSGTLKRVSSFRTGQTSTASWFSNSRTLCYSHEDQLVIVDVASGRDRIFPSPVRGHQTRTPAVSPDGSRIVFQVVDDGIWMLDVASGHMLRVLDDGTAEEFTWDPRGHRVAYQSHRDGEWRIWMLTL